MVLVIAVKSRTFSSFPYSANEQACRSWQGAQPGRSPNRPMEISHTMDVMPSLWMGVEQGAGIFLFFHCCEFESSLVWVFKLILEFSIFWKFWKIYEIRELELLRSLLRDWLWLGIGWWENCVVYSLFCIFIIISSSRRCRRSSSSSSSFVVLLNCLYLNPGFYLLSLSPPHPAGGKGEGWASSCLVLSCQLLG